MSLARNYDQERLIGTVRDALSPGQPCYLVGGAVRDYLLGRSLHDLDFALPEGSTRVARRVAKELKVGYFILDDQRHTARVVYKTPEGESFPLDFVQFTGETLAADLSNRDFTLNAMALSVDDMDTVIDPLHGQADLEQKILRPCSPHALVDDPVRILRAVRLAKQFSLAYAPGLSELARAAARNLSRTSAERQRDELFRILEGPEVGEGIADAERFGVFAGMVPDFGDAEEDEPGESCFDRSLGVMTYFQAILEKIHPSAEKPVSDESPLGMLVKKLEPIRAEIQGYFTEEITLGRPKSGLALFCIALIGLGIPDDSSELAWDAARRYQLSNAESDWVRTFIAGHRDVEVLASKFSLPDRKAVYHYFKQTGKTGVAVAVQYLAAILAKPGKYPIEEWERQLNIVYMLLKAWWHEQESVISPRPLLNGNEIQKMFDLPPGALIGEILKVLQEAQASGEVQNREEARKFIAAQLN